MIRINLYCIGTLKEDYFIKMCLEYLKRLQKFAKISVFEFKECVFSGNENNNNLEDFLEKEDSQILSKLGKDDYVILLDLHGKEISSEQFAKSFQDVISTLRGDVDFVIGGTYGVSKSLQNRANFRWKFSELTFTHQMCRPLLLEQIYRAFKINNNEKYHH
ncbi:MAG: 23S rRNA (pseudouridine(1915)-N(3))-methyltransferase RlmH [Candidatus Onthovivens sp.]|nr:23S rRNA (pseudouridine(1915)-N(3))-methyltransferase RlmH [Candidatus Onthovivens sp.]